MCLQADAQLMMAEKGKNTLVFKELMKSEVGIYLGDNEEINAQITEAFENYWTVTPYRLLTKDDYNQYQRDEHKFFISLLTLISSESEESSYFVLMNGLNKSSISFDQFICYVPVDRYYEYKFGNMMRRFDYMVSSMNDALQMVKDGTIPDTKKNNMEPGMAAMSKNAAVLKEKTLLIPREIINVGILDFKEMKSYLNKELFDKDAFEDYPYKYQIMPYSEIEEIEDLSKYCLLIPAGHPIAIYFTVYDMETKKVVLMTQANKIVTSQVKSSHIKKITEAINGE